MTQQQPPKPGRGRPEGRNVYVESTTPIRIPKSKITAIKAFLHQCAEAKQNLDPINPKDIKAIAVPDNAITLPLYSSKVLAGFPSPADDHVEKRLNLHEYLVEQESATF